MSGDWASVAARLIAVVVLPSPAAALLTASTCAELPAPAASRKWRSTRY